MDLGLHVGLPHARPAGHMPETSRFARGPGGIDPNRASAMREASGAIPASLAFAGLTYRQMDVTVDPAQRAAWVRFSSQHSPSFTHDLLDDLLRFREALTVLFQREGRVGAGIDFVVSASRMRGVYNLGGDLTHFAQCIRSGNREALRAYAHKCCEMIWHGYTAFRLPVVLVGLVEGDALGGGFECALSCGVIVAERRARFGMPEVLFNMFPGMGAYSLLSRRIGGSRAMEMILSGRIYTAEEMHALGVVDVLAEDGEGEAAVGDYIRRNARKVDTLRALQDVRRRVDGLTREELLDVTERWVEQAMELDENALRRMEKIRAAQARRRLIPVEDATTASDGAAVWNAAPAPA